MKGYWIIDRIHNSDVFGFKTSTVPNAKGNLTAMKDVIERRSIEDFQKDSTSDVLQIIVRLLSRNSAAATNQRALLAGDPKYKTAGQAKTQTTFAANRAPRASCGTRIPWVQQDMSRDQT